MYVMKLDVYAHCSIDHISTGGKTSILAGGSACYCGIMAANLGSNVHLVSKYGDDFAPYTKYLDHKKINYSGCLCDTPSTSFDICEADSSRVLRLKNLCEPLQYVNLILMEYLLVRYFVKLIQTCINNYKSILDFSF